MKDGISQLTAWHRGNVIEDLESTKGRSGCKVATLREQEAWGERLDIGYSFFLKRSGDAMMCTN